MLKNGYLSVLTLNIKVFTFVTSYFLTDINTFYEKNNNLS